MAFTVLVVFGTLPESSDPRQAEISTASPLNRLANTITLTPIQELPPTWKVPITPFGRIKDNHSLDLRRLMRKR
jgi:hypothetical protein